jgi:hypothetical protein
VGELPRAVTRFKYSLSDASERALLEALEHEFVDAVVDDVMNGVAQSLRLVESCLAQPHISLHEMVHSFPWERGLKRSVEWKRKHIADQLRSMIAAGVPLPETVVTALGDEGEPCFAFNEIAFAVAPKRLEWSWSDFKKQQGYGQEFLCIAEAGDEADISAEGVDYGAITVATVMLQQIPFEVQTCHRITRSCPYTANNSLRQGWSHCLSGFSVASALHRLSRHHQRVQ